MKRLFKAHEIARYLSVSRSDFDKLLPDLLINGFPDMLPVLERWDLKAVDVWLDKQSGIEAPPISITAPGQQQISINPRNNCPPSVQERATTSGIEQSNTFTVEDVMIEYLEWFKVHRRTYRDCQYQIKEFILPEFGHLNVEELTTEHIRKWLNDLASRPKRVRAAKGQPKKTCIYPLDDNAKRQRRSSANRVLDIFKAALNRAFRDGKISNDVAWRRVESFKNVKTAHERFLTVEESRRLVEACPPDFKRLVQAALHTGARFTEICRMRKTHFSDRSKSIVVPQSKSGKPRHIALTDEATSFFIEQTKNLSVNDTIFTRFDGVNWKQPGTATRMKDACQIAKIEPPITFHHLRHTYASLLVMNGCSMAVVARNLGHASTEPCEKYYAHLASGHIKDSIENGMPTLFEEQDDDANITDPL